MGVLGKTLACLAVFGMGVSAAAQTKLLRDPALSERHIAFVYAGDIWLANLNGSAPQRLTSHPADESNPVFSPDGRTIAFTANYEGNTDVYSISINGGQPVRHTWHPGPDIAVDWSPSGDAIAFVSRREVLAGRSSQLYHVALGGGLPERQLDSRIFRSAYDAGGDKLAVMPFGPAYNALYGGSSGWRGYRGGTSPSIQILEPEAGSWIEIPGERVNDIDPMWADDDVYFISDRADKVFNIHRYDVETGEIEKITDETVWDIRAADLAGNAILYEAGGELKFLDLATGDISVLAIGLTPDLPQLRPAWKEVRGQISAADLSNTGKRVAVTARGEVFSVPVKDGSVRNLSDSSGVREYGARWSPDGTQIAYIVETGEGQLLRIEDQSGITDPRDITLGSDFYSLLDWGGEGEHIIYQNNHLEVFVLAVASGERAQIASEARRQFGRPTVDVDTSPDGRWVALALEQPNFNRDLFLYNTADGRLNKVTNGLADVGAPAFSPDGKLLYFTASTNAGPTQVGLDMTSQERPYRAAVYVAVLDAEGASPLLPKAGEETGERSKSGSGNGDKTVTIDLEGLADRMVALPVPEAAYSDLAVAKDGALFFIENVQPGSFVPPPGQNPAVRSRLMRFDPKEKSAKQVSGGVVALQVSDSGSHIMLQRADGSLQVAEAGAKLNGKSINLGSLRLLVDPRAEWAQIFDDVWRMEASYFYDPDLHGLDWQAVYDRYRPLVSHVGRREDLNELMAEMIAEMQAGHNRLGGGDIYRERGPGVGLLGADYVIENGRHKIARIYSGESWNPFLDAPLAKPGVDVAEGDFILAVNGVPLAAGDNIHARMAGTTGVQTVLRVSDSADGSNARDVTVVPAGTETALRLWAWVEGNRKAVDAATGGRVGYVYLPNTAGAGFTFFNRMFFAQTDKEALIIDERANGGGQAANYITDVLSRRYLAGWKDRDGLVFNTPGGAMFGPKVMLIDQDAGSGGDFLPYSFRHLGIGPLIGKRTWGGLIGISVNPGLVDGGFLTVPYFRYFDTEGNWTIENEGVAPDIDVALDPMASNEGRDTQLERAIAETLSLLVTEPSPVPTEAPAYPTELGR